MKVGDLVKFKNPAVCDRVYLVVKTDANRLGCDGGLLQRVWIYPRTPPQVSFGYYFALDLKVLNESR